MNGMSYGLVAVASPISMKDSMSIRRSIISHKVMKLLGKIDFAIIWSECKRDLANRTLILYQIPISYQMNLVTSMLITKS